MTTLPDFNKATFKPGDPIDNSYYPLKPGTIYTYEAEGRDRETGEVNRETNRVAVTYQTKEIAGVTTTVVRDTVWANGFLEEDTNDFYAQDTDGNVWYLGEATTAYQFDDNGNFIGTSTQGAWEAGVNDALPGYIMEANPQINDNYYQEFAINDGAFDQAQVISRNRNVSTKVGDFSNVLQTYDTTQIDPSATEFKYYAPGIGMVAAEENLDKNLEPELAHKLVSINTVTPEAFTSGRGTKGNDVLEGNNKDNVLTGEGGNDLLKGFDGSDRLLGQEGNDFLVGGRGSDTLKGGEGEDILIGGNGSDILTGGKDRDQFVFRSLTHKGDTIKDFTRQDVIVLVEIFDSEKYGSSNPFEDYLQIQQVGSGTVIRLDADGDLGSKPFEVLATLQNTNVNILSDSNFVV
jgi:Ca2+-binding RTX toxin-like protein